MNQQLLKNNKNKGFSLLELIIVLGIGALITAATITKMTRDGDKITAKNAGLQYASVGKALGTYIARESGSVLGCLMPGDHIPDLPLTLLTTSTGSQTYNVYNNVGVAAGYACTLNNRQILPSTFLGESLWGPGYNLTISANNSGSVGGFVLSSRPIVDDDNKVRYDWMGEAMKEAGPDSGMIFTTTGANILAGLGGAWQVGSAENKNINTLGLFGYRSGYLGLNDDSYLRLDGAYPMRGNLNMGNFNINNATDLNFNGWLTGNFALVNNLKTGYISNSGNIQTDTLTAETSVVTGGREGTALPPGMSSGDYLHTLNIYSEGTIAVGQGGTTMASIDNQGLISAKDIFIDGGSQSQNGRTNQVSGWLSDRLPRYVSRGAVLVRNGDGITKPDCTASGGDTSARVVVVPQIHNTYGTFDVGIDMIPQPDGSYVVNVLQSPYTSDQIVARAVDMGSWWQVELSSWTAGNKGATNGEQAIAETYCDFGA